VVTGDTYESVSRSTRGDLFGEMGVTINIFNISKINSEVRGGKSAKSTQDGCRRYLGESYYDYLAESARSRTAHGRIPPLPRQCRRAGPSTNSSRSSGLELTATPKVRRLGAELSRTSRTSCIATR
jgi:hypothetical protein